MATEGRKAGQEGGTTVLLSVGLLAVFSAPIQCFPLFWLPAPWALLLACSGPLPPCLAASVCVS